MKNKPTATDKLEIVFSEDELLDMLGDVGLMPEQEVAKQKSLLKHNGPGPHESGSPQQAHAGNGASSVKEERKKPPTGSFADAVLESGGGFTYHPVKDAPKKGFVVSVSPQNNERIHVDKITPADIARYIKKHRKATIDTKDMYIGGWHDPEDGMVHLDTPHVVENEAEAIRFAKKHNERAIFNLSTAKVVEVVTRDERDEREKKKAYQNNSFRSGGAGLAGGIVRYVQSNDRQGADRIRDARAKISAIRKRLENGQSDG